MNVSSITNPVVRNAIELAFGDGRIRIATNAKTAANYGGNRKTLEEWAFDIMLRSKCGDNGKGAEAYMKDNRCAIERDLGKDGFRKLCSKFGNTLAYNYGDNPNYSPEEGMRYLASHFDMFDLDVAREMIRDAEAKGVAIPPGVIAKARKAGILNSCAERPFSTNAVVQNAIEWCGGSPTAMNAEMVKVYGNAPAYVGDKVKVQGDGGVIEKITDRGQVEVRLTSGPHSGKVLVASPGEVKVATNAEKYTDLAIEAENSGDVYKAAQLKRKASECVMDMQLDDDGPDNTFEIHVSADGTEVADAENGIKDLVRVEFQDGSIGTFKDCGATADAIRAEANRRGGVKSVDGNNAWRYRFSLGL